MMLLHQDLVAFGLFERMESFAVQVLHQLDFQHLAVIERAHDGWDRVESGFAAGAPAPLAGDDFKSLRIFVTDLWPHDDRLDHLDCFDVFRQLLERGRIVMRSSTLLDRGPRGFNAFQGEISDGKGYRSGA